jgi:hypothetical protein
VPNDKFLPGCEPVTVKSWPEMFNRHKYDPHFRLQPAKAIDDVTFKGADSAADARSFFRVMAAPIDGDDVIDICYSYVYANQKGLSFCCGAIKPGHHELDIEHVSVRVRVPASLDVNEAELLRVYFGAHSPRDGVWRQPHQITMERDTHPVAYAAYSMHGFYYRPGCACIGWCFATDYPAGGGMDWNPPLHEADRKNDRSMKYIGMLGRQKSRFLQHKDWFNTKLDMEYSTPCCRRAFCCCKCCTPTVFDKWFGCFICDCCY